MTKTQYQHQAPRQEGTSAQTGQTTKTQCQHQALRHEATSGTKWAGHQHKLPAPSTQARRHLGHKLVQNTTLPAPSTQARRHLGHKLVRIATKHNQHQAPRHEGTSGTNWPDNQNTLPAPSTQARRHLGHKRPGNQNTLPATKHPGAKAPQAQTGQTTKIQNQHQAPRHEGTSGTNLSG